jgi:hypothetical protein
MWHFRLCWRTNCAMIFRTMYSSNM